jgi:hypothetical protein
MASTEKAPLGPGGLSEEKTVMQQEELLKELENTTHGAAARGHLATDMYVHVDDSDGSRLIQIIVMATRSFNSTKLLSEDFD